MKNAIYVLLRTKKWSLGCLLLVGIIQSCGSDESSSAIRYMDNAKVFNEFKMKKDYDLLMEDELKGDSEKLDSLGLVITNFSGDTLKLMQIKKDYYLLEQQYNMKFQKLSEKYTSQVHERLNDYIKKFAEKNELRIVLGNNGGGTLMYVHEDDDVTEELIKFLNETYSK